MAPELYRSRAQGGGIQTTKMDVWSLFVTILWVLDEDGFRVRANVFRSHQEAETGIINTANRRGRVHRILEMAILDPCNRASAAQMLRKCFNDNGLSTPKTQFPPLVKYPGNEPAPVKQAPTVRIPFCGPRHAAWRGIQAAWRDKAGVATRAAPPIASPDHAGRLAAYTGGISAR